MAKNRILQLRKSAKLTQRELAERAGTSQQQIQRVEAGVVAVRLDLANKIADALQVRLPEVFPALAKSAKVGRRKRKSIDDPELAVDLDPRIWTAKFFTFDGREYQFELSSFDQQRLESTIGSSDKRFFIFNSQSKSVAVNISKLAACQFLFDPPFTKRSENEDISYVLKLHLASAQQPLSFELTPDTKTPEEDEDGFASQLGMLFIRLDGADDDEILWFDDADEERVYVRSNELVLVEAPLECRQPSLLQKTIEGRNEAEQPDKHPSRAAAKRTP
jgi:transcriptional regulator with XRE-family HTH domain